LTRVIVHADPDLSDLIPGFLARKREDVAALVAAADRCDYDELARIGHKIKGEGGSYGFAMISDIGAAIELGAKARDLTAVHQSVQQFTDFLGCVEIVYD